MSWAPSHMDCKWSALCAYVFFVSLFPFFFFFLSLFNLLGMLTLEDFGRVYDLSQRQGKRQSRNLQSQFRQRNKHTWLYQGPGSHHVLHTLRNRCKHIYTYFVYSLLVALRTVGL